MKIHPVRRKNAAPGAKNQRAQDDIKAGPKVEKSAQDTNVKGEKPKSVSSETIEKGKDMKAEGREDRNGMKAEGREDRNGNMKAETKGAETRSQTTTGQAGAGAKLSTEQRTKITSVIREQHVAPVNNVNFSISVGTRVPREVSFHPLPAQIVTIYPEWRGYEYFLVRDQIVVVDPRTLEIVAVLRSLNPGRTQQVRGGQRCPPLFCAARGRRPKGKLAAAEPPLTLVNELFQQVPCTFLRSG